MFCFVFGPVGSVGCFRSGRSRAEHGFVSASLFARGWEGSGVVQPWCSHGATATAGCGAGPWGGCCHGGDRPAGTSAGTQGAATSRDGGRLRVLGAGDGVHLAGGKAQCHVPNGCPSPELAPWVLLTHPGAEPSLAKAGRERINRFRPGPSWFLL